MIVWLMISLSIYAQDPEVVAESNKDLRSSEVLYRIENKSEKSMISLERTNTNDYNLVLTKAKDPSRQKISRIEGQKLDAELSSIFIDLQIEQMEMKNCSSEWELILRKEKLDWCIKDEKKTQALKNYWEDIQSRF